MGGRHKRADIGLIAAARDRRGSGEALRGKHLTIAVVQDAYEQVDSAWSQPSTRTSNERISTITLIVDRQALARAADAGKAVRTLERLGQPHLHNQAAGRPTATLRAPSA